MGQAPTECLHSASLHWGHMGDFSVMAQTDTRMAKKNLACSPLQGGRLWAMRPWKALLVGNRELLGLAVLGGSPRRH